MVFFRKTVTNWNTITRKFTLAWKYIVILTLLHLLMGAQVVQSHLTKAFTKVHEIYLPVKLCMNIINKQNLFFRDIFKSTPNLKDMTSPSSRRTSPNVAGDQHRTTTTTSPSTNAASPIGHVYHASAPPSGAPYMKYYERSHSYNHPHQPHHQPKSVSPIVGDIRGRSGTDAENRARVSSSSFSISVLQYLLLWSEKIKWPSVRSGKFKIAILSKQFLNVKIRHLKDKTSEVARKSTLYLC